MHQLQWFWKDTCLFLNRTKWLAKRGYGVSKSARIILVIFCSFLTPSPWQDVKMEVFKKNYPAHSCQAKKKCKNFINLLKFLKLEEFSSLIWYRHIKAAGLTDYFLLGQIMASHIVIKNSNFLTARLSSFGIPPTSLNSCYCFVFF